MVCTTTELGKQVEGTENHTHPCRCTVCAVLCAVFLCAMLCCVLCFCVPCSAACCVSVYRVALFLCSLPPHWSPTTMPPTPPFNLHVVSVYAVCVCKCVSECAFSFFSPPPPLHQSVPSDTSKYLDQLIQANHSTRINPQLPLNEEARATTITEKERQKERDGQIVVVACICCV